MLIYFVAFLVTTCCQSFGNEVTFLGLLPLYNFFSNNRPVQHPTLSLYESLNPTQFSTTPRISPLVPVYAFLNNYGSSQLKQEPRPTYDIPKPMIASEESNLEISTETPTTTTATTSRPPLPPPPSPPPPPLPPPLTSSLQNIYSTQTNKSKRPLPVSRPSGSYRPYRPIKHPPTPPPGYRVMASDKEEYDGEIYMSQETK